MNPQVVKEIAINLSSLGIPLSFYAGFLMGKEDWVAGLLVIIVYMVMDNIGGRLWFSALEDIK